MDDATVRWIVVALHPHREATAIEHLARQGFSVYCPHVERVVMHARQKKTVRRPLFPGYCFVALGPEMRQWRPIQSTVGVRHIIRFGESPATVAASFIAALQAREIDGVILRPAAAFMPGDTVRITDGAFAGVIGKILTVGDKDRVTMLLELLQRPVSVETHVRHILKT